VAGFWLVSSVMVIFLMDVTRTMRLTTAIIFSGVRLYTVFAWLYHWKHSSEKRCTKNLMTSEI
jgi:hypothetical protein